MLVVADIFNFINAPKLTVATTQPTAGALSMGKDSQEEGVLS
jgi:hypothetical protein